MQVWLIELSINLEVLLLAYLHRFNLHQRVSIDLEEPQKSLLGTTGILK
jgi:hypothetical protein